MSRPRRDKEPGITGLDDRIINNPCTPEQVVRNWEATRKALADLDRAPNILNARGDLIAENAIINNLTVNNFNGGPFPVAWVALVPCNFPIPAEENFVPGWASCCLYVLYAPDVTLHDRTLVPVTDSLGNQVRVIVYNVYDEPVRPGFVKINVDGSGNWLNDTPPSGLESVTTTTTTTSTSSTMQSCQGRCKWVWVDPDFLWNLESSDCELDQTTTSTTTSTTTTCLCPIDITVNTSTTTTSTTTTPFCRCQYPDFCGENGGECTYTGCITGFNDLELPCTTTTSTSTSTSCDCATTSTSTTTTLPSNCQDGCRWGWVKDPDTDRYSWVQITDGCSPDCPCLAPDIDGYPCQDIATPCNPVQEGDCQFTCAGDCTWMWFHDTWILMKHSCLPLCSNDTDVCQCVKPSFDGNELCQLFGATCQRPEVTTTTPADPCWRCYTTTSTTTSTTTTEGCNGDCTYNWSTAHNGWIFVRSECPQYCPCGVPATIGQEDCEYTKVPCGTGTTTTSTTTTPPCSGDCIFSCDNYGGGNYLWTFVSSDCASTCECPPRIACGECNPAETPTLTVNCCKDLDHNGDCLEPPECITPLWYCKGGLLGTLCATEATCTQVPAGQTFESTFPGYVRCGGPWSEEASCIPTCSTSTTTTTTSTTTTPPNTGACCCLEGFGFPADCSQTTQEKCGCDPRQSQFYLGRSCEEIGCPPGCSGSCLWASTGDTWFQFTFCDDGCECAYPDEPPSIGGNTSTFCLSE